MPPDKKSTCEELANPENFEGRIINEYYSLPMALLHHTFRAAIQEAVTTRPEKLARDLLASLCSSRGLTAASWEELYSQAGRIEEEIGSVLSTRSAFFWQHLYRRTFPMVRDEKGEPADEITTSLVRSICEAAIAKYGNLSGSSGLADMATTDINSVFGGWLVRSVNTFIQDADSEKRFLQHMQGVNQWVIVDFVPSDLVNLYYVEALCFQYWKATARLRSVGKGALLVVHNDGSAAYVPDPRLRRLLSSYDNRAALSGTSMRSSIGTWFEDDDLGNQSILNLLPNVTALDLGSMFARMGLDLHSPDGSKFIANFVPFFVAGGDFERSHRYIAEAFRDTKGYSISSAIALLHTISALTLTHHLAKQTEECGEDAARAYNLYSLCKRGYITMTAVQGTEFRRALKTHLSSEGFHLDELNTLLASLTLNEVTRAKISLWSRGPQFVFFPYDDVMLINFSGIVELLHNLFVGVRDDAHARGMEFESNVRASLLSRGIEMERRNFKFTDGSKGEADAVFYRDSQLVVVDCFSIWRPLDFEISRPRTVAYRQRALDAKARYAVERSKKLDGHRIGKNFDFSAAAEIVTIVVTPEVEWLWDESELLWVAPNIPRIMQADEFIAWATNEQ